MDYGGTMAGNTLNVIANSSLDGILTALLVLFIGLLAFFIYQFYRREKMFGLNNLLVHFPISLIVREEENISSEFSKIGVNFHALPEPINPSFIATILNSVPLNAAVVHHINFFEGLCAFVDKKVLDEDAAKELYNDYVVKTYKKFSGFIENQRKADKNEELWAYMEKYAKKWAKPDPRYDRAR
jgi:hypothetical protein